MKPVEYTDFLMDRIVDAALQSWTGRKPGKAGWGQGQAVIAPNRRTTCYEDQNLDVLFFSDIAGQLVATAVNVPCPSQEVITKEEMANLIESPRTPIASGGN